MPGAEDLEEAIIASVERAIRDGEDDLGPDPDVDPAKEIPAPTSTWAFGQGSDSSQDSTEVTTEQAIAAVHDLLEGFRNDSRDTIGPRDFRDHLGREGRIGRSRAWLSPLLADLADQGTHLADTDTPGVYKLLYPELTHA